jgi:hypothetical protein
MQSYTCGRGLDPPILNLNTGGALIVTCTIRMLSPPVKKKKTLDTENDAGWGPTGILENRNVTFAKLKSQPG